jgi:hypothetical protein
MREFSKLPNAYKPDHRASHVVTVAHGGAIAEDLLSDMINMPSTGGASILHKKN